MLDLRRFMPWLRSRRVPLPAKVFMSYLVVVLVGARLPTYFFLYRLFLASFMTESVRAVAVHAQLMANFLSDYDSVHQRVEELRHLGPTMVERLTYVSSSGRVLLESAMPDVHSLDNHLNRPEIERALGKIPPDERIDIVIPRVGISRRAADNTNVDTVYVAVRLAPAQGTEDFLAPRRSHLRAGSPLGPAPTRSAQQPGRSGHRRNLPVLARRRAVHAPAATPGAGGPISRQG